MIVDAHQHFWNLTEVAYSWLAPVYGPIYSTFEPSDLEPLLRAAGVDRTVLVQAANSYEDTASMLRIADFYEWVGAVVGWVDLLKPDETAARLAMYHQHLKFRGIRHLIHDEPDPDWVVQSVVLQSLKLLERHDMLYEIVAVFPNHLRHVPTLAENTPDMPLVIDHLAKPPIKRGEFEPWAEQLARAAKYPNVYAKVSGLNTAADWETWSADDLRPYIDFAIEQFGAERLIFGSDWPVALLAGDYARVYEQTRQALAHHAQPDIDAIMGGTAQRLYHL